MARTAKFAQVGETLRQRIRDGSYSVGSRLPSENELPAEFGVGKQTIVRVMSELLREGLIVRRQGKGTFVARRNAFDSTTRTHPIRLGVITNFLPKSLDDDSRIAYLLRGIAQGIGMPRDGLSWEKSIDAESSPRRA